jgi:hypothetical protein
MNAVFQTLSKQWYVLRGSAPGERFRKILDSRANARGLEYQGRRNLCIASGGVMIAAGLTLPLHAAALALILAGVAMLARESWTVACLLDLADVRLHAWLMRFRRRWSRQEGRNTFALAVWLGSLLAAWVVGVSLVWSR